MKERLVKLRHHLYVSESDPDYYKKYLQYFPDDKDALFQYAKQLERSGQINQAITFYERAFKNGHPLAQSKIRSITDGFSKEIRKPVRDGVLPFWVGLLMFLIGCASMILTIFSIYDIQHFTIIRHFYYYIEEIENSSHLDDRSNHSLSQDGMQLTKNDLARIVLDNAIVRFQQLNGHAPGHLSDLVGAYPNNMLSYIPAESHSEAYTLSHVPTRDNDLPEMLSLDLYPETNQLAVETGSRTIAIYPVATGKDPLPFTQSQVFERIINPNGGTGPFGTRGFELADNYAIHGTNDPLSIGKKVTHGCIRMLNQDIETLFPYISKGTSFYVKSGKPNPPIWANGLPPLSENNFATQGGSLKSPNESTATQFYWNN